MRQVTEALASGIESCGREVVRTRTMRELWALGLSRRCCGAILSLESGYLAPLFPRTVYILHGYPLVGAHSPVRRMMIRAAARAAKIGPGRLVAVSHITRSVHEMIYGIPVDRVIFNGASESLNDHAYGSERVVAKRRFVTYVGRLIETKGVRAIVQGFLCSSLPGLGYELKIAGSGPLAPWLDQQQQRHPSLRALGEVSEEEKERLLFESEAFVSLHNFEPMGVVFVEAVLAGCKIVAPFCGGHREFVPTDWPVSLCDAAVPASVTAAFDRIPHLASPRKLTGERIFSYPDFIARQYLDVLDGAADVRMRSADSDRAATTAVERRSV